MLGHQTHQLQDLGLSMPQGMPCQQVFLLLPVLPALLLQTVKGPLLQPLLVRLLAQPAAVLLGR